MYVQNDLQAESEMQAGRILVFYKIVFIIVTVRNENPESMHYEIPCNKGIVT